MMPETPQFQKMPSVVCLVAHPDDETIWCGGTLALLAAKGVAVHLAAVTRGEGGDLGEPPLSDRAGLGAVREREMVCAAGKLGVRSLTFLGYVDPTVGPDDTLYAPAHDPAMLSGQIIASLKQAGAQVLLTHGSNGEYGHPAHQLVHRLALAASMSLGAGGPLMYSFSASYPAHPYPRSANADDPADIVVDFSEYLDQKVAAALCHVTQNPLFIRAGSEAAGRPLSVREVMLPDEAFHRHWPQQPPADDPFLEWVRLHRRQP
jgi:LmbE family N-acetylglucosaminyl deacetylase